MKIYFPKIVVHGNPLIWELDEKTGQAVCLFYCTNKTSNSITPELIIKVLTCYPWIKIRDGKAIIEQVDIIKAEYLPLNENPVPSSDSKPPMFPKQKSSFFKTSNPHQPPEPSSHLRPRSLSAPLMFSIDASILLDDLIPNDEVHSSLWGDTVSYEKYFLEKNIKDATSRTPACIRSAFTFNNMVQYEKNNRLLPVKSNTIKIIRELLELLNPVYGQWYKENTLLFSNKLIKYFQSAIANAMLNDSINNKATEFDSLAGSQANPILKDYLANKARALRAELMLMNFLVLIKKEYAPELVINSEKDKELEKMLLSLREFFLKQGSDFLEAADAKLAALTEQIIVAGKIEESNQKLSVQLNQELANQSEIRGFVSFKAIVQQVAHLDGHKEKLTDTILHSVVLETIQKINAALTQNKPFRNHQQYISPLSTFGDQDFYLLKNWAEGLEEKLVSLKLKHPKAKDEKKIKIYSKIISEEVLLFAQTQLEELMSQPEYQAELKFMIP